MSVVCMCVLDSCDSQRSVSGVSLSHCFRQGLKYKLDFMIQLNCLTSKSQGEPYLCLSSSGTSGVHPLTWLFTSVLGN